MTDSMRFRVALLVLIMGTAFSALGCVDKNITVVDYSPSTWSKLTLHPEQYSTNHFFLDTLYRKFFESLHRITVPQLTQEMFDNQVIQLEVYVSQLGIPQDTTGLFIARAYIDLPPHDPGTTYQPDQINELSTDLGRYGWGLFKQLGPQDFKFAGTDKNTGTLTMLTSVAENQVIAVAYTILGTGGRNETYGTPQGSLNPGDTLVLKLIKPMNLSSNPSYHPAWDLMLRNIYKIPGTTNLTRDNFDLTITHREVSGPDRIAFEGHTILEILGLDQYDENNNRTPDGRFDFFPGVTVDPERGEVIFPTLRPFDSTIAQFYRQKLGKEAPDTLLVSPVYDTTVVAAGNYLWNRYSLIAQYDSSLNK
jgi:hypothetical protein